MTLYAVKNLGANAADAVPSTIGFSTIVFPLLGRVMQGSAETVFQSVLYEIAGTVSELWLADAFLRSKTPVAAMEIPETIDRIVSVLRCKKKKT